VSVSSTTESIDATYRARRDACGAQAARFGRHGGKLAAARGVTFLVGVACLVAAYRDADSRAAWIAGGTLLLVLFLAVAILDDWLKRRREHLERLRQVNDWQLARRARDWAAIPVPSVAVPPRHAAVARDLDLFGRASVFQLINLAHTPRGMSLLRDWILEPAAPEDVTLRQAAVKELAPALPLREELVLRGHLLAGSLAGPEAFVSWAEGRPYYARRPWCKWTSRLLALAFVVILVALFRGAVSANAGGTALVLLLACNVLFSVLLTGDVHDIFNNISSRNREMQHYLALFELVAHIPADSARLRAIRDRAVRDEHGALRQLKRLRRIMSLAGLRHASLLSILYVALQATVLWDFHVLVLLERWQKRCGSLVRDWFDALGELEALCSLSCLVHDNPTWCFPRVDHGSPRKLQATGLGHPLLPDRARVANDVEVGPEGTVLLVTGSNMSGKSTLLRAIGVNALLAGAGAPVCARDLRMPPVSVLTSMRIQDSLEDGVSFFMAELKRLKQIVDQATRHADRADRALLYLLDEVLQGTNSVERHIAVARVLAHLVAKGAIGAVSTHDLELARSPVLADASRAVHFRETLHGKESDRQMTFDYLLRPGVATTTNALKLLEMVGLVEP